jgi:dolichyl-phosphate-mannose-protein mannosyltransferase
VTSRDRWALAALLVVAGLVRIIGLEGSGHRGDLRAFELWAEGVAQHGLGGYYAAGGDANYPAMLYLLWPLGLQLDGAELWRAIRTLSIPFDLGLGIVLFEIGRRLAGPTAGLLAGAFYLLNPAIVLSGTPWGQVDSMGALPMIGAIVAVATGGLVVAGALATLATLVKPQFGVAAFVIAGLMVSWLGSREGIRRAAIVALAALLTFVVILLPLNLDPLAYRQVMADTFERYPYASHYAFNPWAIAFGFGTRDGAFFYLATALTVGAIGLSLLLLRVRRDLVGLLAVGALIGLTLYFVPTRVHERYLYGAIALLAPLAATYPRLRSPFLVLSGLFFVTLAYVVATSPYDILPLPGWAREDLPHVAISLLSAALTAAGAWCAWRVVEIVRNPADDARVVA